MDMKYFLYISDDVKSIYEIGLRKIMSEGKCIVGRRHLAYRRELAKGEQSFRARCERIKIRLAFSHRTQCETAFMVMKTWGTYLNTFNFHVNNDQNIPKKYFILFKHHLYLFIYFWHVLWDLAKLFNHDCICHCQQGRTQRSAPNLWFSKDNFNMTRAKRVGSHFRCVSLIDHACQIAAVLTAMICHCTCWWTIRWEWMWTLTRQLISGLQISHLETGHSKQQRT